MTPFQQGELDGLCGIYSVINAARLVIGRSITEDKCEELFVKCFAVLEKKKKISHIITNGITINEIACLLRDVIEKEFPVRRTKPFHSSSNITLADYWSKIQEFFSTSDKRRAVILSVETEEWEHWSVVRSTTNKRLALFDSDDSQIINRKRCTLKRITKVEPILFHPNQTYFLQRK